LLIYFLASDSPWRCIVTVQQQCVDPVYQQYAGMNFQAILEKIRTTDLRETCAYV